MKKPLTNIELVTKMMNFSEAGALKQAFIIEAIRVASEQVLKGEPWAEDHFVSHAAWKLCAQEC